MEGLLNFLPMIIIVGGMMFFMSRTQKKRMQAMQEMMNSIQKGTEIVTIGGLHGVVEELNDDTVVLDCEGVYLTFERRAIGRVVSTSTVSVEDLQPRDDVEVEEETTAE
ncbi:preprotein translocase subunit YajC [Granulicatella sp. zg-ZJ]|uniref:preprotein translocase subunit YajC n=1 Tax=unclassified Granulicatella TaxID=2630493 RepID=UPI0013BFEFD3|nr:MULTISPECIES: preprotein translocase subunit YajC [unclassified Granulicatella]MBS4751036.1 preprotein translocase subunit YajC [Carnobacteriaceae bacterium zg-ZUI78]NEW63280.1 preprotein translocase subunit YajC [Granulicatella sp. zg-ZJ]NEW65594.1 preprotein translocase subunit YajC [Granulicatella sp. zg-84]QMI85527.1 preprotein translocase subunit YajC [Carnobacteriaceae bacterium zg-84]